jgi:hypothetical protein
LHRLDRTSCAWRTYVCAARQGQRDADTERGGSLEIDEQLEPGRLLDRQVRRLGAGQNPAGVNTSLTPPVGKTATNGS